ncbi:glycine receptor subunit alpha-3 [Nephila pilipes]|uniref:Glycine receptor subunit alpha-3 n=1 Tax=Nephila pilipes TaxID=299642 RepID=A0A8X6QVZ8_NEPPI|nr:glycine receptor subunit alpha-3 [Nephila pilipes]
MRKEFKVFLFMVFFCLSEICDSLLPEQKVCTDLLPLDYAIHKPPAKEGKSTKVFTWVQVLDFGDINQANMDFLLHTFVIIVWNDTRLQVEQYRGTKMPTTLYPKCREHVWMPQLFFETTKDAKSDQTHLPSTEFKILPDGAVYVSTKFILRAMCELNLVYYPFDSQTCVFKISLMSPNALNELKWIGSEESPYKNSRISVQVLKQPHLLLFYFKEPTAHSVTEEFAEGNYTSLMVNFRMTRRLTGSVMNVFIPSTMIVVMSFVGFWLSVEHVPARVALSVTSLLTLCTQVHQYRTELPPVNYVKAMDIWLFVCIFFVFSTLVEFAFQSSKENEAKKRKPSSVFKSSWAAPPEDNGIKSRSSSKLTMTGTHKPPPTKDKKPIMTKIDEICRYLYPALFVTFVIIYWSYYLRIYHKYG